MVESSDKWSLAILSGCSEKWSRRLVQQFQEGISSLLSDIEDDLQIENLSFHLRPVFLNRLSPAHCHGESHEFFTYAIIDVTDFEEDLAHLLGVIQGSRIPYVAVCQRQSAANANRHGLSEPGVVLYDEMTDLFRPSSDLRECVSQTISPAKVLAQLVYELWFPRDTPTIWVVCPQCHDAGEFAEPASPDYTYLDNLGDTDALLEIMVFLSRYYPNASIEKFSSDDLPKGHTKDNIVVIGGPGSSDDISNRVCLEMMSSMNSRVSYSEDCERMVITGDGTEPIELRAELQSEAPDGCDSDHFNIRRDYGYFARFPNPLNEHSAVILVNGIHTTGVLGAAKAFGDGRDALRNYHSIFNSAVNPKSFECHFGVGVLNGNVRVPSILPDGIYPLGHTTKRVSVTPIGAAEVDIDPQKDSITVLFIAGDRGGGQSNQLQIPRERDAINEAIQSSNYRDSFKLAQPIFGVTIQKLALAYCERPSILHFAGHGNERSLSFILDHGAVASNTPVVDKRLAAIVSQFPNRVRLCVLNTCSSASVAEHLVQNHAVDAAIGWPGKLTDSVAIAFSRTLYKCLGDGLDLLRSMRLAGESSGSTEKPVLHAKDGIDPKAFTFCGNIKQ
jgi:hypothetical protein